MSNEQGAREIQVGDEIEHHVLREPRLGKVKRIERSGERVYLYIQERGGLGYRLPVEHVYAVYREQGGRYTSWMVGEEEKCI